MWLIKSETRWLHEHATRSTEGFWYCKKTGKPVKFETIGRSIWEPGTTGGYGEVRYVAHLYCSGCSAPPGVNYGSPIYEDELAETKEAPAPT